MDLAVTLVKAVLRAFYPTREILVIDALILHEALRDDDLAYLMSINTKDLHKICGKLREDRFLSVYVDCSHRPRLGTLD
jgi:transcription initiation factor TFIIE subunit alpha